MSDAEVSRSGGADYWQAPNAILIQPKRQVGDRVADAGFRVPVRYGEFEEGLYAVKRGWTIVVRSEHPSEFAGPSGLLGSCLLDRTTIAAEQGVLSELLHRGAEPHEALSLFRDSLLQSEKVERYRALTREGKEQFYVDTSFSFWEHIPGINITVAADDAVADRYHIVATATEYQGYSGWITNQAGESDRELDVSRLLRLEQRGELIQLYESVRNLPCFSSQECPIMEWQLDRTGAYWFLQYHKARRFQPHNSSITAADYPAEEGWRKASVVRGALGPLVTLQAAVAYPFTYGERESPYQLPETESASFDQDMEDVALGEVLSRRRTAYLARNGFAPLYRSLADGHEARSQWLKPQASLAIGRDALSVLPEGLEAKVLRNIYAEGRMARFVLDAASDGRQAYWRLNPDSEQPIYTNS